MTALTPAEILALPMQANDADAATIRDYLARLLAEVWEWGEEFSGKRPFDNSGWEDELFLALVNAGAIQGGPDKYGDLDCDAGRAAIAAAIKELGAVPDPIRAFNEPNNGIIAQ